MTELALDAEMRAEERRGELRDKLLGRVGFRAEAVAEFALEARLVPAPMPELVQGRWKYRSADSNAFRGGNCSTSREGTKHALLPPWRISACVLSMKRWAIPSGGDSAGSRGDDTLGQAVDLRHVEDGVGAQHAYLLLVIVLLDSQLLREDHVRSVLALADVRAEFLGLLEVIQA